MERKGFFCTLIQYLYIIFIITPLDLLVPTTHDETYVPASQVKPDRE